MKTKMFLSLFSILTLTSLVAHAEQKITKTHSHDGRTHTHVLPKAGVRHSHNKNKKAPVKNTSSHSRKSQCGSLPTKYKKQVFGNILYALETSCNRTLSKNEQGFIAGASQTLLRRCKYPTSIASRIKLERFLTSSAWAVVAGTDYSDKNLGKTIGSQAQSEVTYATGVTYAKSLGCTHSGKKLANNIVKYITKTSSGSKDKQGWVAGCVSYYSGRYSKAQCQCIADFGRAVIPNIHQTRFSPYSIKKIIKGNPFIGMQIAFKCQVGDY